MFPVGDDNTPPVRLFPFVNLAIIAACVVVFLLQQVYGTDTSVLAYGTVPYEITHGIDLGPTNCTVPLCQGLPEQAIAFPVYLTLLTSIFMHAGLLHIGGNMLFLFIFGDNVEDALGHVGYAIFYLLTGLVANFAQIFTDANSPIPGVGASGAIAGVSETDGIATRHAFLYQDGQMHDLAPLPSTKNSIAYAINSSSQVVGASQTDGTERATLWHNGKPTDLNRLLPARSGWVLTEARAINDHGQIAGQGLRNGKPCAFLLTPR